MPLNTVVAEKLVKNAKSMCDVLTVLESHKEVFNETVKTVAEETGLSKRIVRKFITAYYKGTTSELAEEDSEFVDLVELTDKVGLVYGDKSDDE